MVTWFNRALRAVGLRRIKNESNGIPTGSMDFGQLMKWIMSSSTLDRDLHGQLDIQRREARRLARENPLVKQYLHLLTTNVIGSTGMRLQAQVRNNDGNLNKIMNDRIEAAWGEFWKSPWADGRLSGVHGEHVLLKAVANDGEAFVRMVPGYPNKFGFALQMIDAELVDHSYNSARTGNDNEIRLGVEIDSWGRPVGFWCWSGFAGQGIDRKRIFIPAAEIIHLYDPDRIAQTRGVTWHYSIMLPLKMINGFVEAVLVAERTAACAFPVFKQSDLSDIDENAKDFKIELNPGSGFTLPAGLSMESFTPSHPGDRLGDFIKAGQRFISSGWGVSYNALANDLEGVNYSSMRSGLLIERDRWRVLQEWWIDRFRTPVYAEFTRCALLTGALKLDSRDPAEFSAVKWIPRGWLWVDPLKDVNAAVISIENGLGCRTDYLAEQGRDFEDVCERLKDEKLVATAAGLDFSNAAVTAKDVNKQTEADQTDPEATPTLARKNATRLFALNALMNDELFDTQRLQEMVNLYRTEE